MLYKIKFHFHSKMNENICSEWHTIKIQYEITVWLVQNDLSSIEETSSYRIMNKNCTISKPTILINV